MNQIFLKKWIQDLTGFAGGLVSIGCTGDISLRIGPRYSKNEVFEMLKSVPGNLSEAVDFLADFYSVIGSSLVFDAIMVLPEGLDSKKRDGRIWAHLEVVSPDKILELAEYNKDRYIDSEPSAEMLLRMEEIQKSPLFPNLVEELHGFREIVRECLMFCVDDTGGGIVFYNGGVRPTGVYAVTMDTSALVCETMPEFFGMISQQCYPMPTCETDWSSQWGPSFRAKLEQQG